MRGLSPPLSTAPWQVPRLGMATPFRGRTLQEVTKEVVSIAKGGLERRGMDEVWGGGVGGRLHRQGRSGEAWDGRGEELAGDEVS
jgi:glutamate--cysteine ligase